MPPAPKKTRPEPPNRPSSDWISRAELARRKGCARSSASRACATILAPACRRGLVDANSVLVRDWLVSARRGPSRKAETASAAPLAGSGGEIEELAVRRRRAEADRAELRNDLARGRLIERAFVAQQVTGGFESLFLHLLRDAPKVIAARVGSVSTIEQRTAIVLDALSGALRRAKAEMISAVAAAPSTEHPREPRPSAAREEESVETAKRSMAAALQTALVAEAAPAIVDSLWKDVGRAAAEPFNRETFERVLAMSSDLRAEATRRTASVLEAYVRTVLQTDGANHD